MTEQLSDKYDVVIAGGGPAGSSLAIRLAQADINVLLVEQKKFPREKVCGEFLSPECLIHFEELGVSDAIGLAGGTQLAETVFYKRNGKGLRVKSEWFGKTGAAAVGLSRATLDEVLLRRAAYLGVTVLEQIAVNQVIRSDGRVQGVSFKTVDGNTREISAGITVDATGRTRALARRFDEHTKERSAAEHVAFKSHLRNVDLEDDTCEIYVYRGGYGGCNQVEGGLFDLCFIAKAEDAKRLKGNAESIIKAVVFSNKRAAMTMKNAEILKPWLAVPIEKFGRGNIVPCEGMISVGDSASFIDPFTGSGMLMALQSAKIAFEAISANLRDPKLIVDEYRRSYGAAFDSRLRVCSMLRNAAFSPFIAESTISLLSLSSGITKRLARATRMIGST